MAMNKKGEFGLGIFFGLMLAITIVVLALGLASPTKQFTDAARNETDSVGSTGLNCTNPLLSDYDKGACQITDLTLPFFIGALIFIAGIYILAKFVFEAIP